MELSEAFSPGRAISHGIAAIQRAPASLLIGGFLIFLVDACTGGGGNGNVSDLIKEDQPPEVSMAILMVALGMMAVGLVIGLAAFLVRCWLLPGWIRLHRHVLQNGTDSFPVLFSGGDAFVRTLLWRLLYNFITFGTFIVALLPAAGLMGLGFYYQQNVVLLVAGLVALFTIFLPAVVYITLGLSLGDHAVALEGLGPVDALDRSWELARGNRLTLFVFFLVTGLFSLLGLFLCCIGAFATRSVSDVGTTEAYLLATTPGADKWLVPSGGGM